MPHWQPLFCSPGLYWQKDGCQCFFVPRGNVFWHKKRIIAYPAGQQPLNQLFVELLSAFLAICGCAIILCSYTSFYTLYDFRYSRYFLYFLYFLSKQSIYIFYYLHYLTCARTPVCFFQSSRRALPVNWSVISTLA